MHFNRQQAELDPSVWGRHGHHAVDPPFGIFLNFRQQVLNQGTADQSTHRVSEKDDFVIHIPGAQVDIEFFL